MGGGPTGDRLRGRSHLPPCAPQRASPDQDVTGAGPSLSLPPVLWPQKKSIVGLIVDLGEARALLVPSMSQKGYSSQERDIATCFPVSLWGRHVFSRTAKLQAGIPDCVLALPRLAVCAIESLEGLSARASQMGVSPSMAPSCANPDLP